MNDFVSLSKVYYQRYKNIILVSAALILLGAAALYFYSYWRGQIEQAAQYDFYGLSQDLKKAQQSGQGWQDIATAAELAYAQHTNSILSPYFLAIQAQALAALEQYDNAIALMNALVAKLNTHSPFYYLFTIKRALLQLSSEQSKQEGLKNLELLAADDKNPQQDEALYYLGYQYYLAHNKEQAWSTWEKLLNKFGQPVFGKSPWAELAKTKMSQLF